MAAFCILLLNHTAYIFVFKQQCYNSIFSANKTRKKVCWRRTCEYSILKEFHFEGEVCLLPSAIFIATSNSLLSDVAIPVQLAIIMQHQQHWCWQATQTTDSYAWVMCVIQERKWINMQKCVWCSAFYCSRLRVLVINSLKHVELCLCKSTICSYHVWSDASQSTI